MIDCVVRHYHGCHIKLLEKMGEFAPVVSPDTKYQLVELPYAGQAFVEKQGDSYADIPQAGMRDTVFTGINNLSPPHEFPSREFFREKN